MKKLILSSTKIEAKTDLDENLQLQIDDVKDNFDYAIDGIVKISKESKDGLNKANQIILKLAEGIEAANKQVAGAISGSNSAEGVKNNEY